MIRIASAQLWVHEAILTTDDCRRDYEALAARGVEFTETPEERPYGIDGGFRDPSGNSVRLTQLAEVLA